MNVGFIHPANETLATYRLRSMIPAEQISQSPKFTASINEGEVDVAVFSKPVAENLQLARQCKQEGTKVVVDIGDNHFNHSEFGKIYREIIKIADQVVCPTIVMQGIIKDLTGKDSVVIPDSYESERSDPHANGTKVLWLGHGVNVKEVVPYVGKIEDLSVCTSNNRYIEGYMPWSLETQKAELEYTNIVILPSTEEHKSANRLINAIMAGCFVVSAKTEVKKEFREFAWINDIYTGLRWCRAFQNDLNDLVSKGQDYIQERYSKEAVGKQWLELVEGL